MIGTEERDQIFSLLSLAPQSCSSVEVGIWTWIRMIEFAVESLCVSNLRSTRICLHAAKRELFIGVKLQDNSLSGVCGFAILGHESSWMPKSHLRSETKASLHIAVCQNLLEPT